jgi:hypothetical protein
MYVFMYVCVDGKMNKQRKEHPHQLINSLSAFRTLRVIAPKAGTR